MNSLSWDELLILLEHAPEFAARAMHQPCSCGFPPEKTFSRLMTLSIRAGLANLLRRHVISCMVEKDVFQVNFVEKYLQSCLPLKTKYLHEIKWITFPVLTCRTCFCSATWILAGMIHKCGSLPGPLIHPEDFSSKAVAALHDAVAAATACSSVPETVGFIILPLTDSPSEIITGRSLGLAVSLALFLLMKGRGWPNTFFATGDIDSSGRILSVDRLAAKQEFTTSNNSTLICPAEQVSLPGSDVRDVLPCRTLSQAAEAAVLASDEVNTSFPLIIACMQQPRLFLRHLNELPLTLIKSGRFSEVCRRIADAPERYMEDFSESLTTASHSVERAELIADIYSPEQLTETARRLPSKAVHVFRTLTARIACFSHTGDTANLLPWLEAARGLVDTAGSTAISSYYNHCFTALRHNRFHFSTEIPDDFANALSVEEQVMAIKKEESWLLGAMYGTLAQNYGFCGPEFLENVEWYAARGTEAFGTRYASEAMRLKNYLTYALLDAGKPERAYHELVSYIQPDTTDTTADALLNAAFSGIDAVDQQDGDAPFRLSLTLRFLADTKTGIDRKILDRIRFLVCRHKTHPWQLTALNAARIALAAGLMTEARALLEQALETCMSGSATMNVMGLLPLSLMHVHQINLSTRRGAVTRIIDIISDRRLMATAHFTELVQTDEAEGILEHVAERPQKWFPFSYR